jgi:hypothetical protein
MDRSVDQIWVNECYIPFIWVIMTGRYIAMDDEAFAQRVILGYT